MGVDHLSCGGWSPLGEFLFSAWRNSYGSQGGPICWWICCSHPAMDDAPMIWSEDANFEQFLDCHIESYQSAGGPKLNKEAWGRFLGTKRGLKTTWNLEPTCWTEFFQAFEVSVRKRESFEQGEFSKKHDHGNNSEAHSSGEMLQTHGSQKRKATSLGPTFLAKDEPHPRLARLCSFRFCWSGKLDSIGHGSSFINALGYSN